MMAFCVNATLNFEKYLKLAHVRNFDTWKPENTFSKTPSGKCCVRRGAKPARADGNMAPPRSSACPALTSALRYATQLRFQIHV